jgi:O-antigen ligase
MMELVRRSAVPGYLMLCLLLGGASAAGAFANLALQLLGLALLLFAIGTKPQRPTNRAERQLLWIGALTVVLVLLHLAPLPPTVWSSLPGRQPIVTGFELLARPLPWLPTSLAPNETIAAGLHLLPPLAIAVAMIRIGHDPRWTACAIIGVALASVPLGTLQIAGGEESPWRAYQNTSGNMRGLFANSNHLATLLLIAVPLAGAFLRPAEQSGRRKASFPFVAVAALAVLLVGILFNTSLAGLLLLVPVAAGTLLCFARGIRHRTRWLALLLLLGTIGITAALAGPSVIPDPGLEMRGSAQPRYEAFRLTIAAAVDHAPLGSGLGTFQEVYRTYEDPFRVDPTYMNHTHNDYLEVALEAGLPALALVFLFLLWWLAQARHVLASDAPNLLARAGTVATAAVLLHSMADYPLRTAAIAAAFAACCLLMAQPDPASAEERE